MDGSEFRRRMALGEAEQNAVMVMLYREVAQRVKTAAKRVGRFSWQQLDDITQDVCIAMHLGNQKVSTDGSIWPWVSKIAYNKAIDILRRPGDRPVESASDDNDATTAGADPAVDGWADERVFPRPENADCIRRVLDELEAEPPARNGSMRSDDFLLHHLLSADLAELADRLGISAHSASERRSQHFKKLRGLCNKFCGDDHCGLSIKRA